MRRRGFFNATPSVSGTNRKRCSARAQFCALLCALAWNPAHAAASDGFGGSLGLASDYLVRGISRTDHEPALQLDLHYSTSLGFFAGVFASNTRLDRNESRDAELSAYLGYAWMNSDDWHGRILLNHYAYPWNDHGSKYNYDELDLQVSYQGWVQLSVNYSPNTPRYLQYPVNRLNGVSEQSVELNLQRPIVGKLSAIGGVGGSHLGGPYSGNYVYFSAGAAYDIGAFSLAVSYVDTTAGAKALFYNEAAENRVTGTIIWRF
jgi:uncharacterized protein (TIGR02001 family)